MTIRQHVASKLSSGKWLLTMAAAGCLVMITIADCWLAWRAKPLMVDPATILSIITMCFVSYFAKPARLESDPNNGAAGAK